MYFYFYVYVCGVLPAYMSLQPRIVSFSYFRVWEHVTEGLLYGRQETSSETGMQEETMATYTPVGIYFQGLYLVPAFYLSPSPSNIIFETPPGGRSFMI